MRRLTKGGRQRGTKLDDRSSVHRQENRVLTNHSSSPAQAISWMSTAPVTWQVRGRKQASWLPAGGNRGAREGALSKVQTCHLVARARRVGSAARPMARSKVR